MKEIIEKYDALCKTPSDINQLLPHLKAYAEKCEHITEMGTRAVVSTYAFLASKPKKLVCYDIGRWPEVDHAERMAAEAGIEMVFKLQDVLEADIEPTDFLFIDTYHSASQLELELARHADKARMYIGFHDIATYGRSAEPPYEGIAAHVNCGRGLLYAIEPFLEQYPEWKEAFRTEANNGLLILSRV